MCEGRGRLLAVMIRSFLSSSGVDGGGYLVEDGVGWGRFVTESGLFSYSVVFYVYSVGYFS